MYDDKEIIETNDDATMCKYSLKSNGYTSDDYVELFIDNKNINDKKPPLINRFEFH
jgi:hypothetical protein